LKSSPIIEFDTQKAVTFLFGENCSHYDVSKAFLLEVVLEMLIKVIADPDIAID
jgi:hypothetical protein